MTLRLAVIHADVRPRRLGLTTQVHSSTATTAAPVSVKCAARVGRRDLRVVVNVYRTGFAHCSWRLPRDLEPGTRAHGWVKVTQGPLHVRRVVQARARLSARSPPPQRRQRLTSS